MRKSAIFRAIRLGVSSATFLCLVVAKFTSTPYDITAEARNHPVFRHTLTGNIHLHQHFQSKFLQNERNLIVYLPPGYDHNSTRRYPVLYVQDGQNIFDAATSFFAGRERHMDEAAEELIRQGKIEPLIIVGVYSVEFDRISEYTPTRQPNSFTGGHADLYGRMLVEELKPFIDANYRTLPDREHTALGGASLGGLVTLYVGLKYPNVFGKLSATSPAAYWDHEMIVRFVRSLHSPKRPRVCLSVGSEELPEFLNSTRDLRRAFEANDWKEGADFGYFEAPGEHHDPEPHPERVKFLLRFLFPTAK